MEKNLITRRRFLVGCAGLLVVSCRTAPRAESNSFVKISNINELEEGFNHLALHLVGIFKEGGKLTALSLMCTHQQCPVDPQQGEFICKCHGSKFAKDGTVLSGPAEKNLPWLPLKIDGNGDVSVRFDRGHDL
jgi:Rieske Fe-S protein